MTCLSDLFSAPQTAKATIRGKEATLTELSSAQTDLIYTTFPEPMPPMKAVAGVPMNGPDAFAPDETDADYRAKHADWSKRRNIVEVAVALDFKPANGPDRGADFKAWADAAYADIAKMPNRLILQLLDALNSIGGDEKSFSSAPAVGPTPTTAP